MATDKTTTQDPAEISQMGFDLWALLKAAHARLDQVQDIPPHDLDETVAELSRLIRLATGMAHAIGEAAFDLADIKMEASHV